MNAWKHFCRQIEGNGDRFPLRALAERTAIFEVGGDGLRYDDGEAILPPFPFPNTGIVAGGEVFLFTDPIMAEDETLYLDAVVSGAGFIASGRWAIPRHGNPQLAGFKSDVRTMTDMERNALADKFEANGTINSYEMVLTLAMRCGQFGGYVDYTTMDAVALHAASVVFYNLCRPGLRCIRWINKPDHYTVEVGPTAPSRKGKAKNDRIARFSERTRYIVLTKNEITEAWHKAHNGGTHASPIPHLRRGHYRQLNPTDRRDARRVWVRATHVNGTCVEWRDGDVRYKVI